MINHEWFDGDVVKIKNDGHPNNREILLDDNNEGSLVINKEDVIALAKEFDLVVYHKDSQL
jgi:hypothetical protein